MEALSRWTPEFFKAEFGDMKFTIDQGSNAGSDYKTQRGSVEYTMRQFIDYVHPNCVIEGCARRVYQQLLGLWRRLLRKPISGWPSLARSGGGELGCRCD